MSKHLDDARKLLRTDDKGSGFFPPVSPEHVALAQVHALLAIGEELGRIRAALAPDPPPMAPGRPGAPRG